MLTLYRCPLIKENKHLLRDPELSRVTRNCHIYIIPLDTLKIGIYKLKDSMNCIKVKRNNLLNSIYSSVSPDFRFKETPYVNFFTDPELSSSLYMLNVCDNIMMMFCDDAFVMYKYLYHYLKDAMPISFRSGLFTSYMLTIFKQ